MADAELEAMKAELARRSADTAGNAVPAMSPAPGMSLGSTPGEQMAEDPELMRMRLELERRRQADPSPPAIPPGEVQLSGEANTRTPEPGWLPESVVPNEGRIEHNEALPDLWSAPAVRTLRGATAFSTNSGFDQIEKMLRVDNPDMTVKTEGVPGQKPYKIVTFPGDPQQYAYKPGVRPSDLARAVPGIAGSIAAGAALAPAAGAAALSLPAAVVTNVIQSIMGEGAKKLAGADFEKSNVGLSALTPAAAPFLKGVEGIAERAFAKAAAPVGQTADSLVDPLVQKAKDLLVGYGADADVGAIAQSVAGPTQAAVDAARATASQAAANTETAAASAAAKEAADNAAARAAATTAKDTARTTAEDATMAARNTLQDQTAAAAAKAEAAKVAANAPVDNVLNGTIQALQKWGAGQASSLNTKFIKFSTGLLDDLEKRAAALYEEIEDGFPKAARIQPGKAFQELQDWLDKKLMGRNPSSFLKRVKADTELEKVGDAVRMPQVIDITRAKQLASKVGHGGIAEFADMNAGDAKYVAGLLGKVEDQAARDHGMGATLDKAQAVWAQRQNYRDELKNVLTLRGEKSLQEGTVVPALDAAGAAARKGDLQPLRQILNAAPPGMKQELTANIVNRVIDPAKGPEHMVAAVNAIRNSPEANELVFSNLPGGARKQLLGLAADTERALAKREADVAAAGAAQTAETTALRRGTAQDLQAIRNTKLAGTRAAGDTEAAAVGKAAQEKANTVASAKVSEQTAQEALKEAERLNIALAPKMKVAGAALLNHDIAPLEEMLKSAPGKEGPVVASTLLHSLFDPTDNSAQALKRMTDGLTKLEASPTVLRRIKSFLPSATSDIEAVTELAKVISSGTAAGGTKVGGVLGALKNMGAWAGGKTGGTIAGLGAYAAGGGPVTTGVSGAGGYLLGRILASKFSRDPTIETRAANAFLASDIGKGLLRHLSLEKPVTQGYVSRLVATAPVQAAARVYGMRPERFLRALATGSEHALREGGEQALSPNDTKDEQ